MKSTPLDDADLTFIVVFPLNQLKPEKCIVLERNLYNDFFVKRGLYQKNKLSIRYIYIRPQLSLPTKTAYVLTENPNIKKPLLLFFSKNSFHYRY